MRRLAQEVFATQMADLVRDEYHLPRQRPSITFRDFRQWYATHVSARKRSVHREELVLRNTLGRHFDAIPLHEITREGITEWLTQRSAECVAGRRVSPATVDRGLTLLRHVLAQAVPKYLETNPAAGLKPRRTPSSFEARILSRDEEGRFLACATVEERALVVCALDTLQRLSNVVALQRAQDHGAYITVLGPKTGRSYKVPVSSRLREALDAVPVRGPAYFSWANIASNTKRVGAVIRVFGKLCVRAQIPIGRRTGGVTFHCLRHTGASRMLEAGVDIETVRLIGGWANYEMLQRYVHPTDAARRAAVETIGTTVPRSTRIA